MGSVLWTRGITFDRQDNLAPSFIDKLLLTGILGGLLRLYSDVGVAAVPMATVVPSAVAIVLL